tara:strand:- start:402 stop:1037 length:636 start_codon:yes stop_codon:yes gene_type:complete
MSGISLTGNRNAVPYISLKGRITGGFSSTSTAHYDRLTTVKNYLMENFIEPLLQRKVDIVTLNTFNFTYLRNELNKYKNINPQEVDRLLRLVEFAREVTVLYKKNDELESKLYNTDGFVGIVNIIPAISLKPQYEIYRSFFGIPPDGTFNEIALENIDAILENSAGANYSQIEEKLLSIYEFPIKQKVGKWEYEHPIPSGQRIEGMYNLEI